MVGLDTRLSVDNAGELAGSMAIKVSLEEDFVWTMMRTCLCVVVVDTSHVLNITKVDGLIRKELIVVYAQGNLGS